jgi:hypothetical protein
LYSNGDESTGERDDNGLVGVTLVNAVDDLKVPTVGKRTSYYTCASMNFEDLPWQ